MIVSQFREKRWRVVVEDFWVVLSVSMEHFIDDIQDLFCSFGLFERIESVSPPK